jgi:ABC-2 type transport system ATP-binding protein
MTILIEVTNLVKKYKPVVAVDGIDLAIRQGICFGLLGPNGAGKTTALEVIEDIITPSDGEVLYKGKPRAISFREEIGIQFQHTALLSFLTVGETLSTFKSLYQNTFDIKELAELCKLTEILKQYNDKISGGQRQRLLLALALINKPDLLFLDEPSTGLDPQARRNLWDIVLNVKQEGRTIILTTHSMEEAEYLCDEIAIMDHGKIIAKGTPAELIKKYCRGVTVTLPAVSLKELPEDSEFVFHARDSKVEIQADNVNSILQYLMAQKVDLGEMSVRSPNLEDVFLSLTGRQLRE